MRELQGNHPGLIRLVWGGGGGDKMDEGKFQNKKRRHCCLPTELKTSVFVAVHTGCHIYRIICGKNLV
jgi:hypothetical protein